MSDIKPWQIILIIAAIVVLAFTGWRMLNSNSIDSPNGHMTVDVITGQLYLVQKGKAKGIVYPSKNPDTGTRTLVPVQQNDSDEWILDTRFVDRITPDIRKQSKALGSGSQITVLDSDPIVHVLMK
jgi:hypothetical protein|tara:strand:+ start:1206 stop:1583 length:378 start_codon:yes stop_codon:yes gene_type:complete